MFRTQVCTEIVDPAEEYKAPTSTGVPGTRARRANAHVILEARHVRQVRRLVQRVVHQLQRKMRRRSSPWRCVRLQVADQKVRACSRRAEIAVQLVPQAETLLVDLELWRLSERAIGLRSAVYGLLTVVVLQPGLLPHNDDTCNGVLCSLSTAASRFPKRKGWFQGQDMNVKVLHSSRDVCFLDSFVNV